jgi:hypothetical protein
MLGLLLVLCWLIGALGIAYWCYFIWRRKGRSQWTGFALGFLLTFFLTPIAGLVVVPISYGLADRNAGASRSGIRLGVSVFIAIVIVVALSIVVQAVLHA